MTRLTQPASFEKDVELREHSGPIFVRVAIGSGVPEPEEEDLEDAPWVGKAVVAQRLAELRAQGLDRVRGGAYAV